MQDELMVKEILESYKNDMSKAMEHLKGELASIRAGRANPHILDKIFVDYYGTPTPIYQMANIAVPEARMITISVWDISQVRNISKAIQIADIGVMPQDDGKVIRLIFPMLTEEKRREIVKDVKKLGEESKVALRSCRRDALDMFKDMKKDNALSEDEMADLESQVQKLIDTNIVDVDSLTAIKEKEVMEI